MEVTRERWGVQGKLCHREQRKKKTGDWPRLVPGNINKKKRRERKLRLRREK